VYCKERNMLAA